MSQLSIKQVVAIGVGAALFIVVGLISIPTPIPNTSIQLQYAVQAQGLTHADHNTSEL